MKLSKTSLTMKKDRGSEPPAWEFNGKSSLSLLSDARQISLNQRLSLSLFAKMGFRLFLLLMLADIYIINTCTVTARPDAESRQLVRRANRRNPGAKSWLPAVMHSLPLKMYGIAGG